MERTSKGSGPALGRQGQFNTQLGMQLATYPSPSSVQSGADRGPRSYSSAAAASRQSEVGGRVPLRPSEERREALQERPSGRSPERSYAKTERQSAQSKEDLVRVFSTALVSTQCKRRNFAAELNEITQRPAFRAILNSVRQLAAATGTTEKQAAEEIVKAFRGLDEVWGQYVFQEGLEKLRTR